MAGDMKYRKFLFALAAASVFAASIACGDADGDIGDVSADEASPGGNGTAVIVGDADRGRTEFASEGCASCHSTGSKRVVGPGLGGISQRGDEAYIRESIVNARAFIVDGYPSVMPDYSKFSDQKVVDLIAYLVTLE